MQAIKNISIVGAGPVGSLMAVYLAKRGYKVSIYEKRRDLRKSAAEAGKSINLALSNRGWWPLKEIGVHEAIEKMIIPMRGRMMHDEEGLLTFQPYGRLGQAINSISRSGLNALLMDEAERLGVTIHFNHPSVGINFEENLLFLDVDGQRKKVHSDLIIGADGAYSVIRRLMQRTERFDYSQYFIPHGYKELTIPAGPGGSFLLEKHALHIWPRGSYMLIALPNLDASFTCTLFFPFEGDPSFESLKTDTQIRSFFAEKFPDALELMPSLMADYHQNPTGSMVTVKCNPWHRNKTLLIGDASHAIVPFYGQGMNAGFEDCRVLNKLLNEHKDDWGKVLPAFVEERKPNADAIADLALHNFVEMRDLVADDNFLLRKKIEARLYDLFPDQWIPLYSRVTFDETHGYADALKIGKRQKEIMDEVMKTPGLEKKWEKLNFKAIVDQLK